MGDAGSGTPGRYVGRLILELLDDGRRMRLVEAFGFLGPDGRQWPVPIGTKVDGASIPRALWTFVGGPFEGKYRDASVVHDYYCDVRTAAWRDVHRMFYDAMVASGVANRLAKIMYAGVYFGGPRWSDTAVDNANLPRGRAGSVSFDVATTAFEEGVLASIGNRDGTALETLRSDLVPPPVSSETYLDLGMIERLIDTNDPSLPEIDKALDDAVGLVEPTPDQGLQVRSIVKVAPTG